MSAASERLHGVMGEIVRDNPFFNLATVTPNGNPRISTVLFAPSKDLKEIYWFTSADDELDRELHEAKIDEKIYRVSGSMQTAQRPDTTQTGLTFEGHAIALNHSAEIQKAVGAFAANGLFSTEEMEPYFNIPWHGDERTPNAFAAIVSVWNILDLRTGLVVDRPTKLAWPEL